MNTGTEYTTSPTAPEALDEIDQLLDEIASRAQSTETAEEFHRELLTNSVRALAALGGVIWSRASAGKWVADSKIDAKRQSIFESFADNTAHQAVLNSIASTGEGKLIFPQSATAGGESPNPTEFLLVCCPIETGSKTGAPTGAHPSANGFQGSSPEVEFLIEVVVRPGGAPSQQQGCLRLLNVFCETAGDFHRLARLRVLEAIASASSVMEQFGYDVHRSLDLNSTAQVVANDGRRLVGCDRVGVAVSRNGRLKLIAVSGVESIENRSNVVRRLEELAQAIVPTGDRFWNSGDSSALPPQISRPLTAWREASGARTIAVIPLKNTTTDLSDAVDDSPFGALTIERFGAETVDAAFHDRVELVVRQGGQALRNALDHESLPLYRVSRAIQKAQWLGSLQRLPKIVTGAILAALIVGLLAVVPADFEIEGKGVLQPSIRRNVFARSDGIVTQIYAEHSQECREGEVLAEMTRSQLDFESTRVAGELATNRQRHASVQATRLKLNPQTAADREKYNQLTAEETELKEALKSLELQSEILKSQRDDLLVRSPLTGTIITWNVRQLLEARPVQKGQILMEVADRNGPWELEVDIPDDGIGHVLAAEKEQRAPLVATFRLATEPGTSYRGEVEKISLSTEVHPLDKTSVQVTVRINRDEIRGLRPGATAIAKIHCGRRPIGYVWFHGLWEMIQKKVLF